MCLDICRKLLEMVVAHPGEKIVSLLDQLSQQRAGIITKGVLLNPLSLPDQIPYRPSAGSRRLSYHLSEHHVYYLGITLTGVAWQSRGGAFESL
jgi:hypothetical protein